MKKYVIIILSILVIIVLSLDIYLVIKHKRQKESTTLQFVRYNHFEIGYRIGVDVQYNKSQIKNMLDDIYNVKYTYQEDDLGNVATCGIANIANKSITMNSRLSPKDYVWALSHEIVHIKYKTADEVFTEYTSIITLYECGNDVFSNIAYNRAADIVAGVYKNTEYDCGYYLINYFGWRV